MAEITAFAKKLSSTAGGRRGSRGRGQRGGWPWETVVNTIKGVATSIATGCLSAANWTGRAAVATGRAASSAASATASGVTAAAPQTVAAAGEAVTAARTSAASAGTVVDAAVAGSIRSGQIVNVVLAIGTVCMILGVSGIPGVGPGIEAMLSTIVNALPSAGTMVTNILSSGFSWETYSLLAQLGGKVAAASGLLLAVTFAGRMVSRITGSAITGIANIASSSVALLGDTSIDSINTTILSSVGSAASSVGTSVGQAAIGTGLGLYSRIAITLRSASSITLSDIKTKASSITSSAYRWIAYFLTSIKRSLGGIVGRSPTSDQAETIAETIVNTAIAAADTAVTTPVVATATATATVVLTPEEQEIVGLLLALSAPPAGTSNSSSSSSGNSSSSSSSSGNSASSSMGGGRRTRKYRIKTKRAHYKIRSQKKSHRRRSQKNQ